MRQLIFALLITLTGLLSVLYTQRQAARDRANAEALEAVGLTGD